MSENGAAVNGDVAKCNNTQQRVTTKVRWRTKFGELMPIVRVDCFYSLSCREKLSEKPNRQRTEASGVDLTGPKSFISLLSGPYWRLSRLLIDPFRTVSEQVFSETRIQPVPSLCVRTRAKGFRSSPRS